MRNILCGLMQLYISNSTAQENRAGRESRVSHARQLLPNTLRHLTEHVGITLMRLGSALVVATVSAYLGFGAEILFAPPTQLSDSELHASILAFTAKSPGFYR
jgi:hypothetical protein